MFQKPLLHQKLSLFIITMIFAKIWDEILMVPLTTIQLAQDSMGTTLGQILIDYDGKFLKENEVFHHTFCIIIRTIIVLKCFYQTNCLSRHQVFTFLSYSDLKSNFNCAIHMKKTRKSRFFMKSCLQFFILSCR